MRRIGAMVGEGTKIKSILDFEIGHEHMKVGAGGEMQQHKINH